MTKKISFIILVLICCVFAMMACEEEKTTQQILSESISSKQTSCYLGETEDFEATLSTLTQEQVFLADGKAGELKTQTTLLIKPANLEDRQYKFALIGENGKIEGALEKNVIGTAYIAHIDDISPIGKITKVEISYGEGEEATNITIELTDKMNGQVNADKALEIAYNHYKTQIDSEIASENGFAREIFIRYVYDKNNTECEYCWYVAFVADKNNDMSVLINSETGEIVNSRVRP